MTPEVNIALAERHLQLLDETASNFTFQTFDDSPDKKPHLARVLQGSLDELKDELLSLNRQGAGVFITVNETDLRGRTALNIKRIRSYIAESDGEMLIRPDLDPTFCVTSKRGKHYYWVLRNFTERKEIFTPIQESINEILGTDPTIKDLPRVLRLAGFLHQKNPRDPFLVEVEECSSEYYTQEEIERYFPPKVGPSSHKSSQSILGNVKGKLMPKVQEFLTKPWKGTSGDNHVLVLAISNLKKNNYTREECVELLEGKGEKLNRNTLSQVNAVYKSSDYRIDPFLPKGASTYNEFILTAEVYKDINQNDDVYLVDRKAQQVEKFKQSNVDAVLGKQERLQRTVLCKRDYNPHTADVLLSDNNGYPVLNSYNPPFWKKEGYFKTIDTEMPEVYEEFFEHLFPEEESREYVLNWIAYSLKGKNISVLSLVGTSRGVGKGILACILQELHGKDNSEIGKQSLVSKEFNSHVYGKTFLNLDEVSITKESELESIKAYTNNTISFEGKGSNSETRKLYANLYLTNNNIDCLNGVGKDDRQFSIPDVTSKKLDVNHFRDLRKGSLSLNWMWEDQELVGKLASFLWNRDLVNYDYVANFKSEHYFRIIKTSVPEWKRFIIEDLRNFNLNCVIPLLHIKNIMVKYGEVKPGIAKIEELCREYKELVGFKKIGNVHYILFSKESEEEISFQFRIRDCTLKSLQDFKLLELPNALVGAVE